MELSLDPRHLVHIVWRRRWWFVVPVALVFGVAVLLLLFLPPTYRSEATILIQDQDVPEEIVPSLMSDHVDRRLDALTRRVMLSDNLRDIIERFDLYPEERQYLSRTALVEKMRDAILVEPLKTQITDPSTGRSGEMTVAFRVRFDYRKAEDARRVANELVSLYLSINQETRRGVAAQTTDFLSSEVAAVEDRIARLEEDLARFQVDNRELLPEEAAFKRQLLANAEQLLQSLERDLRSLKEREGFLTTELALTDEYDAPDTRGVADSSPAARLEYARAELATARARYSPRHPDVVRLEREVASLEAVVGERAGGGELLEREAALVAQRASLRERYTDSHPDVARVEEALAGVREAIAGGGGRDAVGRASSGLTRNTAYVQLRAQLNSVQAEIASIEEQRGQLQEERRQLQEELARAPVVEQEFLRLNRQLENAVADREALADKEATAALSGSLETAAIGERLVLAEPASVPLEPVSPSEKLVLVLGLVLAVGSGGTAVVAAELLDRTVRSTRQLAQLLGDTPLAMVPTIVSPVERRRRWVRRTAVIVLVLGVGAGGASWFHRTVVPLDVLAYEGRGLVDRWLATTFPAPPSNADTN